MSLKVIRTGDSDEYCGHVGADPVFGSSFETKLMKESSRKFETDSVPWNYE